MEQQITSPESSSPSRGCLCNQEEEMAAALRRGDHDLITWLRNQNYDNETIMKVRKVFAEFHINVILELFWVDISLENYT